MFEIKEEEKGFRIFCNEKSILSQIPSKDLASDVIEELKLIDFIDWKDFNGEIWMPESLAIESAIEKVKSR